MTELVKTDDKGTMTTTCPNCEQPVTLTVQAFIAVKNSGKRPLCRPCMRAVSVKV